MVQARYLKASLTLSNTAKMTASNVSHEMPRLSVIVPVLNGSEVLPSCLEALNRSCYRAFEVLVVDDGSTDSTAQIARNHGARCIQNLYNKGPASARNLGACHAKGQVLVFVDADVVLPSDGLGLIAEDLDQNPLVAAVFGSYDDAPASKSFVSQYKNLMHHYIHQSSNESASTFWAGCGAIRKSVFDQFGGFDALQYTAPAIEDIALGLELVHAGHKILLDKRLRGKHLKKWTTLNLLKTDIFQRAVPWARLILRTRFLPDDLNLDYTSRASVLLVSLLLSACILLGAAVVRPLPATKIPLLSTVSVSGLLLLFLNRRIYLFFLRKRGWWFATRAVLAHWVYYLYGGLTFLLVATECLATGILNGLKPTAQGAETRKHSAD